MPLAGGGGDGPVGGGMEAEQHVFTSSRLMTRLYRCK